MAETQMPPGSARASSRAAMLTPSPWMSPSSTITSPRLTPTRKPIRWCPGVAAFRSLMPRWIAAAQATASTTLGNSARMPSPVDLTIRPLCTAIRGSISSRRCARSRAKVPASSSPIRRL
jgi:hypothetical protein